MSLIHVDAKILLVAGCAGFRTQDQQLAPAAVGRIALFDPDAAASDTRE